MLHRLFPSHVTLIIRFAGILPCVISSPLWIIALVMSIMNMIISISQNSFSYNVVALLFLAWGGAGAAGWCFFIAALRAYIKQQPWKGWYYVLGLWGLLGVLPFLWFFLKMFLRIILFSKVDFDEAGSASGFFLLLLLILMSILPIYALFIAWYYRPRASL